MRLVLSLVGIAAAVGAVVSCRELVRWRRFIAVALVALLAISIGDLIAQGRTW